MATTDRCECGSDSRVLESRPSENGLIRRRRQCVAPECAAVWATREVRVAAHVRAPVVIVLPANVSAIDAMRAVADALDAPATLVEVTDVQR